jgi:hypothetical protein
MSFARFVFSGEGVLDVDDFVARLTILFARFKNTRSPRFPGETRVVDL